MFGPHSSDLWPTTDSLLIFFVSQALMKVLGITPSALSSASSPPLPPPTSLSPLSALQQARSPSQGRRAHRPRDRPRGLSPRKEARDVRAFRIRTHSRLQDARGLCQEHDRQGTPACCHRRLSPHVSWHNASGPRHRAPGLASLPRSRVVHRKTHCYGPRA